LQSNSVPKSTKH